MAKITIQGGDEFRPTQTGISPIGQVGQVFRGQERGLQAITDVTVDIAEDLIKKRQKAIDLDYVTNSTVKANEEVRRLKDTMVKEIEDPKGFSNDFIAEADKVYNKFLEDAPSDAARNSLKASFTGQKTAQFNNAFNIENKLIADNILSNSIENANILGNNLIDNPFEYEAAKAQFNESLEAAKEVLDPVAFKRLEEEGKSTLIDSRIRGLMNKDLASAEKLVNSDELKDELEPTDILKYRSAVEAEKERLQREFIKKANERKEAIQLDREFGIFKGEVTQLDLDNDLDQGLYGKEEYLKLSKKLEATLTKENTKVKRIGRVEARAAEGSPFDTTNAEVKKDLDTYFDEIVAPQLTPENQNEAIATFVEKYEYVPSTVKSELLAGLHNGSDNEVVRSSQIITDILKTDPNLARNFNTSRDVARATKIANSVAAGMPEDMAVKAADDLLIEKNTTAHKEREKVFKDESNDFDQGEFTSFFVNDPNTVPEGMVNDWKTLYREFAVDHKMDLKEAEDLAYNITKSKWAVSKVAGEPKYMRKAPENYYNKRGLDPKWMELQLRQDVQSIVPGIEEYDLTVNPDSENTDRPGYNVNYLSPEGIPLMLRDNEGNLLIWRPDIDTSEDAARQIKESEQELIRRRRSQIAGQIFEESLESEEGKKKLEKLIEKGRKE
jgi:hypothetical protein